MNLRLAHYSIGDCAVLVVAGEIDISTVPDLRRALLTTIDGISGLLVVDLLEVNFMDCSGLGVLVGARRRMPDAAVMCIVCTHPSITRIFDITGLRRVFPVRSTVDEALSLQRDQLAVAAARHHPHVTEIGDPARGTRSLRAEA